jgi:hypothetical protein
MYLQVFSTHYNSWWLCKVQIFGRAHIQGYICQRKQGVIIIIQMPCHSMENKHCVRRFHPLILDQIKKKEPLVDSMQRWHHMGGSRDHRIKCSIMHQCLFTVQTSRLEGKKKQTSITAKKYSTKIHSCLVVPIFNWFDSASDVVNAFTRGSLLSSSQLRCRTQTKQ